METLVLEMLEDDNQIIQLSDALIEQIAKKIRGSVPQFTTPINVDTIAKHLRNHTRLLVLHAKKEKEGLLSNLIAEMVEMLAKASWLDQSWMDRFNLMQAIMTSGEGLEKADWKSLLLLLLIVLSRIHHLICTASSIQPLPGKAPRQIPFLRNMPN
jgi:hypothetical protein